MVLGSFEGFYAVMHGMLGGGFGWSYTIFNSFYQSSALFRGLRGLRRSLMVYSGLWRSSEFFRNLWLSLVVFSTLLQFLAVSCGLWWSSVVFGGLYDLRQFSPVFSALQGSLGLFGGHRQSSVIFGSLRWFWRSSADFGGLRWCLVVFGSLGGLMCSLAIYLGH